MLRNISCCESTDVSEEAYFVVSVNINQTTERNLLFALYIHHKHRTGIFLEEQGNDFNIIRVRYSKAISQRLIQQLYNN